MKSCEDVFTLTLQICENIDGVDVECSSPLTQHVASHITSHCWVFDVKSVRLFSFSNRGVATGWTGVDMSTPLLPEVVPEIDANPLSFYSGAGGWGRSWSRRMKQSCYFHWATKAKRFSTSGGFAPDHLTRALPWTPMGAPSQDPIIGSRSACLPCVSQSTPHFLTWRRPCSLNK